jgi:GT2 family glycosyltransferase
MYGFITYKLNEMKITKLTILLTFLCGVAISSMQAQVDERESLMSLGDKNALSIDVQNVDKKALESYFKEYFKEFGKVKYNRKGSEYYIDGAKMKTVSSDKVNVYAKMEELTKAARLYLWIDDGTAFVSSSDTEKEYEAAERLLIDFDIYVEKSLIEDELKAAEKDLAKMERDAKQLEKDNEKYKKTIEDARQKIQEMEEAIIDNEKAQDDKSAEMQIHKEAIEEIVERLNNVGKNKKPKI